MNMDDEPRRPAARRFGAASGTLLGISVYKPAAAIPLGDGLGSEGV